MMRERRKKGTGGCRWQRARCGWIRLRQAEAVIFCYHSHSVPTAYLPRPRQTLQNRLQLAGSPAQKFAGWSGRKVAPSIVCDSEQTQKHSAENIQALFQHIGTSSVNAAKQLYASQRSSKTLPIMHEIYAE